MRILVLQDDYPPYAQGGAATIAAQLAKSFADAGHDVLVCTAVATEDRAGRTREDGIEIVRIRSEYPGRWRAYRSLYNRQTIPVLARIMREWKPDIVHAHNIHQHLSYAALPLAKRSGARVFLTAHDAMLYAYGKVPDARRMSAWQELREQRLRYNPLRNLRIRHALRGVRMVSVSDALRSALEHNGIAVEATIHNGIDAAKWQSRADDIAKCKRQYELGEQVVLFGGRLSGAKGARVIIEALALLSEQIPGVQLLVIGTRDASAERMLRVAQEKGVAERVIFTGWIQGEALRAAYHAAATVAVPSLYLDPFPTINLEAMASAKPVVATTFGGSPEAVRDGETGLIVDPHDTRALADALARILGDSAYAHALGEAGRAHVSKEFSLTGQVEAYVRLYATLLS